MGRSCFVDLKLLSSGLSIDSESAALKVTSDEDVARTPGRAGIGYVET